MRLKLRPAVVSWRSWIQVGVPNRSTILPLLLNTLCPPLFCHPRVRLAPSPAVVILQRRIQLTVGLTNPFAYKELSLLYHLAKNTMQYRQLGQSDLTVSQIGMGCVTFGREIEESLSLEILNHAFERGITLFDTAEAYGGGASEQILGKWMADRKNREQILLASKVSGTLTYDRIVSSANESLSRLNTDYIDLFQLHVWDENTPLDESLRALADLHSQGKIRHIGCSNYTASQLSLAISIATEHNWPSFQSIQPPYNLVQREIESDVIPLCIQQQIGIISYSPLGAGFLTGKYRRGGEVPKGTRFDVIPGHQPIYFTDDGYAVLDELDKQSAETGLSLVQLSLKWVLAQPHITSVLIGARNLSQVNQTLDLL